MAHGLPPALRTPEVAQVRGQEDRGGRDREDGDRLTDLKRDIFNAVEKVPQFFIFFRFSNKLLFCIFEIWPLEQNKLFFGAHLVGNKSLPWVY